MWIKKAKFASSISSAIFFSSLDSATDKSNTDNQLLLVLWCDSKSADEKIHMSRLVGIATDGASENVAASGLKGLVDKELQ